MPRPRRHRHVDPRRIVLTACALAALAAACTEPAPAPPPSKPPGDVVAAVPLHPLPPGNLATPSCAPDASIGAPNTPPRAPAIVFPIVNARDVVADDVVIIASPFSDDDGGNSHRGTRYEIARVKSNGTTELEWALDTRDPALLSTARVRDGDFFGDAAERNGLKGFEDYVVRVAYQDSSLACSAWSPFSADRGFRTDDGGATLFDPSQVRTFNIDVPQSTIDSINAEAGPPGCVQFQRSAFPGTFSYTDPASGQYAIFDGAGVSNKGGCGSSRTMDGKASLKVRLSWDDPAVDGCPETRRFFGQKTLTFNNGVQDGTALHERLGYDLYRAAGVPAPRVASANLVVNGAAYGVYQLVETPDRRFLKRFFDDDSGMMYEGAYWCDLVPENVPAGLDDFSCFEREFNTNDCNPPIAGEDAADWELLRALTTQLQEASSQPNFYQSASTFFDMDEFISMWAVDAVIAHWDAYSFHIINNYRVYHNPSTGLWSIMPWGIDQTFNGGGDLDPFSSDTIIVNSCINDPECVQRFGTRLYQVVELWDGFAMRQRAQEMHDQIAPFVYADPRKEYGNDSWESAFVDLTNWIDDRSAIMRQHLVDHGL